MLGWKSWLAGSSKKRPPCRAAALSLEPLEARTVLSTTNLVFVNGKNLLPPTTEDAKLLKLLGRNDRLADLTPPKITAKLANDSAPGGTVNTDALTNDATISGTLKDANKIKQFSVGVDGMTQAQFKDEKSALNAKNQFTFTRAQLETILGSTLGDGPHTVHLFAKDSRGNKAAIVNVTFTLDTTAPSAPTAVDLAAASDSGSSNSDNLTNVTTPTVQGTAQAGDIIRVSVDGTFAKQTTAASDGTWSVALGNLGADGAHNISATASDAAGNASSAVIFTMTLDTKTTLPIFNLDPSSDSFDAGDLLTDFTTVKLTGTTEANATVTLVQTNQTTTADGSGNFSFDNVPLSQMSNDITMRATDVAGNVHELTRTIMLNQAPTLGTAIDDQVVTISSLPTTINLFDHFNDANLVDSTLVADTTFGDVPMELFDKLAPLNVANFLNYVKSGRFNNTIFHRDVQGFVLQGGGYNFSANPGTLTHITTDAAVQNEFGTSNTRGTIAMAKVDGDPNSATSEWFFNLADNHANLDNQNGGFTVIGKVTGNGMDVVDKLAAVPPQNKNTTFNAIPLINFPATASFPTALTKDNLEFINNAVATRLSDKLTFTVASNDNPGLVTPGISNGKLTLTYTNGQTGTANITITATDKEGQQVQASFKVTVNG